MIWIRGDDIVLKAQLVDSNYQPIDITGWYFEASLKQLPKYEDPPIFTLTSNSEIVITNPVNGELIINVPRAYTKNLSLHSEYYFDLVALTPSNQRITAKVWQVYVEGGTSTAGL